MTSSNFRPLISACLFPQIVSGAMCVTSHASSARPGGNMYAGAGNPAAADISGNPNNDF